MASITKFKTTTGLPCVLTHYESIMEMDSDCLQREFQLPANVHQKKALDSRPPYGNYLQWYGVDSLDTVKRILIEGYPEGAAMVDALYDAVAPSLPRAVDFRRRRVRGDQGDELDIHAVNRGATDRAWTTTKRRPHQGSGLIRIAVDICGNSYMAAEQLKWRGVAALALSRAMTKAGYSVEIVAGQAGKSAFIGRQLVGIVTVTVKPRHTAIDTATLAASVCLPGFFRYIGFASIIQQADALGLEVASGLGQAVKLESVLPVPEKIAQVIVPETVTHQAAAVAWIEETVSLLQGATLGKETV